MSVESISASPLPEVLRSKERFQVTPIAYMIFRREDKILLIKRRRNGRFSLPAGHMEKGERVVDTAIREAEEEIGVKVKQEDTKFVHTGHFKDPDGQRVAFFHETHTWEGEPQVMEPGTHEEVRWVPVHELPENMSPYIKQVIQNINQGKLYTEYGW